MIHGVEIHPLQQISDERGKVMHMLRRDATHFRQFGEIYFSTVNPNIVKGWHLHTEITLNYAVVLGTIKLVLCDLRNDSPTKGKIQEFILGEENYCLITVPTHIWNAFKSINDEIAVVANCATHPHNPSEIQRLDIASSEIPYRW